MLEIRNQELWREVIARAISAATQNPGNRKVENWVKQIAYAAKSVETNPYLNYEEGKLIVLSERSLNVYEVDEYCDCKGAVEFGQVCWHRVAKRLWEIYLEVEASEADAILESPVIAEKKSLSEYNDAPYLKQGSDKKPEKIGNIRI
jgi:hypothetical protein